MDAPRGSAFTQLLVTTMTEQAYCYNCLQVRACEVESAPDQWIWTCTDCGHVADTEFKDDEPEWIDYGDDDPADPAAMFFKQGHD